MRELKRGDLQVKILVELSAWYPHYTSSSLGIILDQISPHLKNKGIEIDICTPIGGNIKIINSSLMKYMRKFASIDHYIRRIYFWKKALKYTKQNYNVSKENGISFHFFRKK